jgi:hypothetical protein
MLLSHGPHDRRFATEATETISNWFWNISMKTDRNDNEQSEAEIREEATSLFDSLKI